MMTICRTRICPCCNRLLSALSRAQSFFHSDITILCVAMSANDVLLGLCNVTAWLNFHGSVRSLVSAATSKNEVAMFFVFFFFLQCESMTYERLTNFDTTLVSAAASTHNVSRRSLQCQGMTYERLRDSDTNTEVASRSG